MPNDNYFWHKSMILLGLVTVGVSLIVVSFGVIISNGTNKILLDATVAEAGTRQRTFRVASCDVVSCTEVKTLWKTMWREATVPASTVTETKVVYASGHDRPTRPATIELELEIPQSTTLAPRTLPTGTVESAEKREKKFIRGRSRGRQIVDVNKPEMQM